jgi:hypothetical protein
MNPPCADGRFGGFFDLTPSADSRYPAESDHRAVMRAEKRQPEVEEAQG